MQITTYIFWIGNDSVAKEQRRIKGASEQKAVHIKWLINVILIYSINMYLVVGTKLR